MQDDLSVFDTSLADLPKGEWCQKISEIAEEHGHFQALGKHHFAAFVEDKPILLVTFETVQGLRSLSDASHPIGWDLFKSHGWSHLSIISDGHTWFRDPQVYAYFDDWWMTDFLMNLNKSFFMDLVHVAMQRLHFRWQRLVQPSLRFNPKQPWPPALLNGMIVS